MIHAVAARWYVTRTNGLLTVETYRWHYTNDKHITTSKP